MKMATAENIALSENHRNRYFQKMSADEI